MPSACAGNIGARGRAARCRSSLRSEAPAACVGHQDAACRRRILRSGDQRRGGIGAALRRAARALHSHASHQARQRHSHRAGLRRRPCSSSTTRTSCANSSSFATALAADSRVFRSPDARCDLSRKFGCAPEAVPSCSSWRRNCASRSTACRFMWDRRHADSGDVRRGHRPCRELLRAAEQLGHTLPASWTSAAGFRWIICSAACPSRNSARRSARRCVSSPTRAHHRRAGPLYSAPAAISVTSVMGRALRDGRWWYYLDDGLYGSYSGQMYDHAPIRSRRWCRRQTYPSVLAGPTCDSIDVIGSTWICPSSMWAISSSAAMMGAYTWASASEFNFFPARHGAGARRRTIADR
jgi:hypothetical protein